MHIHGSFSLSAVTRDSVLCSNNFSQLPGLNAVKAGTKSGAARFY
jgi:hypothetical protein